MGIKNRFTTLLEVDFPMIMAPMFLVSNVAMMKAAIDAGIMGTFPTLNFREDGELGKVLDEVKAHHEAQGRKGNYGVNLIVQRSNPLYPKHLKVCVEKQVPLYITSLGNPKEVIEKAHSYGGKVLCDVTNLAHAKKCYDMGCDGFIAVGQGAGGHAGPFPLQLLVPTLLEHFPDKLVISAGGIANGQGIASMLAAGADGVSVGTRFIASTEAGVSDAYKEAVVDAKMDDIVLTERLSGTPCNIIDTPYAKKIGYKQNRFERWMSKNKTIRKYFKMMVQVKGMKKLEQSVKPGNYNNLWSAGQSVELIHNIQSVQGIAEELECETIAAIQRVNEMMS